MLGQREEQQVSARQSTNMFSIVTEAKNLNVYDQLERFYNTIIINKR